MSTLHLRHSIIITIIIIIVVISIVNTEKPSLEVTPATSAENSTMNQAVTRRSTYKSAVTHDGTIFVPRS